MKINIKDSILVAILPFFGYLAAYNYEVGYLSAFNLPNLLAQVKIESIITFMTYIITFSFVIVGLLDFIFLFYKQPKQHPIGYAFIKLTWPFLIALIFTIYPSLNMNYLYSICGMIGLFVLWYFSIPLFKSFKDKKLNYIQKLQLVNEERLQRNKTPKDDNLFSKNIPQSWAVLLLIAFSICILGQMTGKNDGLKNQQFITLVHDKNKYILIRSYGDTSIGVKLNKNKLTKEYIFLKNLDAINFTVTNIER